MIGCASIGSGCWSSCVGGGRGAGSETVAFAARNARCSWRRCRRAGRTRGGGAGGLARRVSPFQARRYVGWCRILTTELPGTYRALWAGAVGEWRALLVARETAWLSREHRAQVDSEVAPLLSGWGDRRVEGEVQTRAYRLDPTGYLDRIRGADSAAGSGCARRRTRWPGSAACPPTPAG